MGLVLNTTDTVTAQLDVQSLSIDASGNVTVTFQKVLVDSTDGSSAPDGSPVTSQLDATNAAAVLSALQPILLPILTAPAPPAA